MRFSRLQHAVLGLSLLAVAGFVANTIAPAASAQSQIAGDIAGVVTDPSGAVVTNAQVTVANTQTGTTKTTTVTANGSYRFALLPSGAYTVTVSAAGFHTSKLTVVVTASSVVSGDVKLSLGQGSETVEVIETAPLLETENSNLSTTFDLEQIQAIPNPGNDITYYAQTSPGVIMNSGGGYGNFSVFGLPGTSNNFTVNGSQQNDPFLNLNNSGPSNLLLGQNDVAEVSVVANGYDAAFGSFGGVQLNETTRAGTNKFHGNATYYYNGAAFNATNWFINQAGGKKANSVNNQWAAGVGGPIFKDKTFFFADFEAIRFVAATPTRVSIPNATYQANTLANLAQGGYYGDPGSTAQVDYFKNTIFALYNNAAAGVTLLQDPNDPDANYWEASPKTSLREGLVAGRIDENLNQNDHFFMHVEYDNGRQPTYIDPLYKEWSDTSAQPEWAGQMAWIRTFTPNITNQFLFTAAHYSAIFQSTNYTGANALLPYAMIWEDESFYPLNYLDYDFPQGRNATQYQFSDDFSWTKGRHTLKAGILFKRDDISNFDTGIYNNPLVTGFGSSNYCGGNGYDPYCFTNGYNYFNRQIFPHGENRSSVGGTNAGVASDVPIAFYNMGPYIEDIWKPIPKLTITAGVRFERNENPVCNNGCFSRLNGDFFNVAAGDTSATPYNSILIGGLHQAFPKLWKVLPEGRLGINYQLDDHTVLRAGVGMFADVFPAQVTDYLARNAPQNPRFQNLAGYLSPDVAGNGFAINQASDAAFYGAGGYAAGGSYKSLATSTQGAFGRPNIYTTNQNMQYPTYEEWNLQLQREFGHGTAIQVGYVGNHGFHEPVVNNSVNAFLTVSGTNFDLPSARPAPSFGEVVNLQSNASSNYNGLVFSLVNHTKFVTAQLNWSWSHALDMVSNGGFLGFTSSSLEGQIDPSNIKYNYGNADYDTRHNISGNYLLTIPHFGGPKVVTADWQLAGTVFFRTGFPFTVTDGITTASEMGAYYAAIPAGLTSTTVDHHCSRSKGLSAGGCFNDTTSTATPYFQQANSFHDQERNQFTGPGFFDTDMSILKGFKIPRIEGGLLQLGAQFYNILNHPNFANPNFDIAKSGGFGFGAITATVGPPTGIYGSGLGGDSSVRLIQFKANFRF